MRKRIKMSPSSGKVYLDDDDTVFNIKDAIELRSGIIATSALEHKKIQEGDHYFISDYKELQTDDVFRIALDSSDNGVSEHILFGITTEGQTEVAVYEGIEHTGGTQRNAKNSDRNSDKVGELTIYEDPLIDSGEIEDNIIVRSKWGTEARQQRDVRGGAVRRSNEVILKTGTDYLFKITASTDNNIINYNINWYEEND